MPSTILRSEVGRHRGISRVIVLATLFVLLAGECTLNIGNNCYDFVVNGNMVVDRCRPPASPVVRLDDASDEEVTIAWDTVVDATEYYIYRAVVGSGAVRIAVKGRIVTSYTDTGLTNGTSYSYTVRAVNIIGESGDSSVIYATPFLPIADAPTNLIAIAGDTEVTLTWNAVNGVISYNIYNDGVDTPIATTVLVTPERTITYTDTGLTNGVLYRYVVRSVSPNGESGNSNVALATPLAPPADLRATIENAQIILNWDNVTGATEYRIYSDGERIAAGTTITATSYTDSTVTNDTTYTYTVRAVNSGVESGDSNTASAIITGIDSDGDLLIEISSLEDLDNIRHSLDGTHYRTSATDTGMQCGATGNTDCAGYELTRNLDFDDPASYDSGAVNRTWRPDSTNPDNATNAGWGPIGIIGAEFATIFEGHGKAISNIYARGSGAVGLFGATNGAVISNLGMLMGRLYGDASSDGRVGGFVGLQSGGLIVSSYISGGTVDGGDGDRDYVGGFIGLQSSGSIVASYAIGNVAGGDGKDDIVGGFVGFQDTGSTITASYAFVNANGSGGDSDAVGGLLGFHGGAITASYAFGNTSGGTGDSDVVGGFSALQNSNAINISSYSTGMQMNGDVPGENSDFPGGLDGVNAVVAAIVGAAWYDAGLSTLGVWNFGTDSQSPAIQYADYDGGGNDYACASATSPPADAILIANCGSLLLNQPGR